MTRRFSGLLLILVLALVVALGFWLSESAQEQRVVPTAQVDPEANQFFAEDFVVWSMDASGQLKYRLSGTRLEQRQGDQSSHVESPVLIMEHPPAPDWTLRSERGWVSSGGDEVQLLGHVQLDRPGAPDHPPMTITSRDVTVWTLPRQAHTNARARMMTTHREAEGVGMTLDLTRDTLELESQVRGTYVPH
ncbi:MULTISPECIES: LPS export ABC transporter periplasmic protein LptC [unclassified Ectothiorhodospira]|uniref:LPS export ABC transporter periplasmic protein LptC n=1 Tax=unclassified Ectothiorhodospira TaxID=2684909 RepID=UPI001EE99783|nr:MULTISPECIES: LPS export ABC transporter periplasmic protein LptC [unclassified Ectothiorhodospira]MCG5515113.1 LPS export ABC transporter periplasmic protein LptC [Ectothiorhodospira sp. 9100]MCG5517830.1 LPS export ABC transporter periplasmic protein LptC [Ectothiorhodospira sp. 9905]